MNPSIQRNASTSPLLKLPGEIREKIFSLVVGHQFIHLLYLPSRGGFRHTVCTAAVSEDEAYEEFMTGHTRIPSDDSADYHSVTFKQRHKHCKSWSLEDVRFYNDEQQRSFRLMTAEERRKPMLDLRILGTCRQMYEEANVLLWTTNTFSFEDSTYLRMFIDGLHSTQINKLKRMHIDFAWCIESADQWELLLRPSFLSRLSALRTLHATFDQYFLNSSIFVPDVLAQQIVTPLSRMQVLPLQHVTVVIGDESRGQYIQRCRWSIAKKREVAGELRNKFLDPNGHEVFAAEMQAIEAMRKECKEKEQAEMSIRQALP